MAGWRELASLSDFQAISAMGAGQRQSRLGPHSATTSAQTSIALCRRLIEGDKYGVAANLCKPEIPVTSP
jgi:hypothetical protein